MMNKLKSAMMTRAMNLMTDPKVMKLLSNPKVTHFLIQAMMAKGKAEELWNDRSHLIARQLNLATQEEVEVLKAELDSLRGRVSDR
jgi:hypothetical protein